MLEELIGFVGRKQSGKDTAANLLIENRGFERVAMGAGLKAMLRGLFMEMGLSAENADYILETERLKATPMKDLNGVTPRFLMQTLGTEWGRNLIWDDIWTEIFKMKADQFDRVVCSDVRFVNEAKAIRELDGLIVKIDADERLGPNEDHHRSEIEMTKIVPDLVIKNNGTVEEFREELRGVLL